MYALCIWLAEQNYKIFSIVTFIFAFLIGISTYYY